MQNQLVIGSLGLLLFGVSLLLTVRMVYLITARPVDTLMMILKITIGIVLTMGLIGFFVSMTGIFALPLSIATVVILVMSVRQYGQIRRRHFATLLALVEDKQIPLAPAVAAFAADQPPVYASRLQRLHRLLEEGYSLGRALEYVRKVVPLESWLMIGIAERTGASPSQLRQSVASNTLRLELRTLVINRLFYLQTVLAISCMILSFVFIKIIPSFVKIFRDFDTELPTTTVALIAVSNLLVRSGLLVVIVLGVTAVSCFAALAYMGVSVQVPFISRFFDRSMLLRVLAASIASGRPIVDALAGLATVRWSGRHRMALLADDVTAGDDLPDALLRHRLIGADAAGAIRAAQRVGNIEWTLQQLADSNERRLLARCEAFIKIASPVVVLCLALCIGCCVVGLLLPVAQLIESLS